MVRPAHSIALVVLLLAVASPVRAAVLELTDGNLTFDLDLGFVGGPAVFPLPPGPHPVAVSSGAGDFVLPPSLFEGTIVLDTALFTASSLISSLNVTATYNTASFLAGGGPGGGFGGVGPLGGQAVVGVLGGLINLSIPLSVVGAGGSAAGGPAAELAVTVTGHLWTTGPAQVDGLTVVVTSRPTPFAPPVIVSVLNTLTLSGYDNRTAGHAGTLQLVSPVRVLTNAAGTLSAFAIQTLVFAPEPGLLVLLAAGALGVALAGRRRL